VFLHVGLNPFLLNERSVSRNSKHKAASADVSIAVLLAPARAVRYWRSGASHAVPVCTTRAPSGTYRKNVRLANTGGDVRAGTMRDQRGKYGDAALADGKVKRRGVEMRLIIWNRTLFTGCAQLR
jgi:hypothetical protein